MSANPERGEVDLVVGDTTYVLRMRMNDLRALQKRMGKTYAECLFDVDKVDVEAICQLLFTFLQPYHAKEFKTVDAVGDLVDRMRYQRQAIEAITELYKANRPPDDTAKAGAANPPDAPGAAPDGTGDNSGSTHEASA